MPVVNKATAGPLNTWTPEVEAALEDAVRRELACRSLTDFRLRMDANFVRAKHIDFVNQHFEAVERGEIECLIVEEPPRHGKTYTMIGGTAWYLGRNPSHQIIVATYGAELSDQISRGIREYFKDERFPFPDVSVNESSRAVDRWETNKGGIVRAAGIGGSLTGFGAHLLLIDDAVRDVQAAESPAVRESTWSWYSSVARTRLMPKGRQIICGTRWHEDDLIGRVLASPGAKKWTRVRLPALAEADDPLGREVGSALWPEWYPAHRYPSVADGEMSSRQFASLYQQRPVPAEGALFRYEWFA